MTEQARVLTPEKQDELADAVAKKAAAAEHLNEVKDSIVCAKSREELLADIAVTPAEDEVVQEIHDVADVDAEVEDTGPSIMKVDKVVNIVPVEAKAYITIMDSQTGEVVHVRYWDEQPTFTEFVSTYTSILERAGDSYMIQVSALSRKSEDLARKMKTKPYMENAVAQMFIGRVTSRLEGVLQRISDFKGGDIVAVIPYCAIAYQSKDVINFGASRPYVNGHVIHGHF